MSHVWQLQEAKNNLSEVVEAALHEGPQIITRRGAATAIVLSYADYRRLVHTQKKLSAFFSESPLAGVDLDWRRSASPARRDPDL